MSIGYKVSEPEWDAARDVLRAQALDPDSVEVVADNDDESIFLLTAQDAAGVKQSELTRELTAVLKHKVWVTTQGEEWKGNRSRDFLRASQAHAGVGRIVEA